MKILPPNLVEVFGNFISTIVLSYLCAILFSATILVVLVDFNLSKSKRSKSGGSQSSNVVLQANTLNYFDLKKGVVGRNLFNSNGEVPEEGNTKQTEKVSAGGDFKLDGPCGETDLPIKLTGTIFMGPSSDFSIATVFDSAANQTDTYKKGDQIIEQPGVRVAMIERKRVVLNNNGSKECIDVDYDGDLSKSNGSEAGKKSSAGEQIGLPDRQGETVVLTGSYVEEQLGEGFSKIIQAARLVPKSDESGNPQGFKIFAIKADSILAKMGFKNGDVITQVNDTSMKLPDQGFALYQSLQEENDIIIRVLRNGKTPSTLKVEIK